MAYYGTRKLLCGYYNGQRVSFEYSSFGMFVVATLDALNTKSLAYLNDLRLIDFS